jgi:hypothetical protein
MSDLRSAIDDERLPELAHALRRGQPRRSATSCTG